MADIPALQKTGDERSTMVISSNKITGGLLRMCTKTPAARFHAELWQCEVLLQQVARATLLVTKEP
ncbi:MAG: hypothetical protein J0H48_06610 [Nitrosospira multiformis]|nr:hypothetical protein [Nitrosospira multiformis]